MQKAYVSIQSLKVSNTFKLPQCGKVSYCKLSCVVSSLLDCFSGRSGLGILNFGDFIYCVTASAFLSSFFLTDLAVR